MHPQGYPKHTTAVVFFSRESTDRGTLGGAVTEITYFGGSDTRAEIIISALLLADPKYLISDALAASPSHLKWLLLPAIGRVGFIGCPRCLRRGALGWSEHRNWHGGRSLRVGAVLGAGSKRRAVGDAAGGRRAAGSGWQAMVTGVRRVRRETGDQLEMAMRAARTACRGAAILSNISCSVRWTVHVPCVQFRGSGRRPAGVGQRVPSGEHAAGTSKPAGTGERRSASGQQEPPARAANSERRA
ncbi:hypothetical protein GGX14DRAFT_404711 [Mycena pura]|uniref:Uncharacterized protein n=1 Tax=Mycena pura TaxID=153505 RepID=A0AAD6Y790_9AGAR|nr:hypothetical protein GGX14DRAFT_404711 [Mycena pura]